MLFNVSGLVQEGIGATRHYDVQGSLQTEGRAPERGSGGAETCSRCLKPLQETLAIDFEEEYQSTVDLRTGAPLSELPDKDAFLIDSQHRLDLTEAVRQYREASLGAEDRAAPKGKE